MPIKNREFSWIGFPLKKLEKYSLSLFKREGFFFSQGSKTFSL